MAVHVHTFVEQLFHVASPIVKRVALKPTSC